MWRGLASAVAVLPVLSGCGAPDDPQPQPSRQPLVSRDIRQFDFGNAEWYDASTLKTVSLKDGEARRGTDSAVGPLEGGGSWQLLEKPQFADVDGDGDEDAAAALGSSGGQSVNTNWYIWLWHNGTALQLRRPFASTNRCARPIEAVTAVPDGFEVQAFLFQTDRDNCAGGGAIPIVYTVGVRDGWPVRIRPEYGPIATCDPQSLVVPVRPAGRVQLRVDADDRSPVVEPAAGYDHLLVGEYDADPRFRNDWVLALAVEDERRVCGWVRGDQLP